MKMRAARMYGYKEPLRLEEIPLPDVGSDEVLIKVAAAGMCRSDYQLVDGYFQHGLPVSFPITPGHEVAGRIAGLGAAVPRSAGLSDGDLVGSTRTGETGHVGSATRATSSCAVAAPWWASGRPAVSRNTWWCRTGTSSGSAMVPMSNRRR